MFLLKPKTLRAGKSSAAGFWNKRFLGIIIFHRKLHSFGEQTRNTHKLCQYLLVVEDRVFIFCLNCRLQPEIRAPWTIETTSIPTTMRSCCARKLSVTVRLRKCRKKSSTNSISSSKKRCFPKSRKSWRPTNFPSTKRSRLPSRKEASSCTSARNKICWKKSTSLWTSQGVSCTKGVIKVSFRLVSQHCRDHCPHFVVIINSPWHPKSPVIYFPCLRLKFISLPRAAFFCVLRQQLHVPFRQCMCFSHSKGRSWCIYVHYNAHPLSTKTREIRQRFLFLCGFSI